MNDATKAPTITCIKCKKTAALLRHGSGFEVPKGWETMQALGVGSAPRASNYEGVCPACSAKKK